MRKLVVRPPGLEDRFPAKQWKWDLTTRALVNEGLGVRQQVVDVVYEDTGEFHHEGVVILSRRIEIHVVIRDDGHVGLVYHRREKMVPPEVSSALFAKDPMALPSIMDVAGIEEYETVHGLAAKRFEEAEEETGYCVAESVAIGFVKDSPSLGGVAHELFATILSRKQSDAKREEGEQIMGIKFFPPEEVRNVPTICGLTQASLWRFRAWGLKQPTDSLWYTTASRL